MSFVIRRKAARVLCFDPAGRLLLIRSSDPVDHAKPDWWELPGGGVDHGEQPEEAIRRELVEEAGVTDAIVGPCVWVQHAVFTFSGLAFDQHERIHVARCGGSSETLRHLESLEALAFQEERWWDIDEFMVSDAPTVPPRLREFLPDIVAGHLPDEPIDITPHE